MRLTVLTVAIMGFATLLPHADARGHHGNVAHYRGMSDGPGRAEAPAADQRHASDDYVKQAAEDEDKLLDTKIKSICRGC